MEALSSNPSITMKDVLNHPEIQWNISHLSINPSITFWDVLNHPELDWYWGCLSSETTMFRVTPEFKKELTSASLHFSNKQNSYRYYCTELDFKIRQYGLDMTEYDKLDHIEKRYLGQFKKS